MKEEKKIDLSAPFVDSVKKNNWGSYDDMKKDMEMSKNTLVVSDEFVDIYKHFSIFDQVEKIKKLDDIEIYLLLILCLDKHDDNNPIVVKNLIPFRDYAIEIYATQDATQPETTNVHLLKLMKLTGDNAIATDVLFQTNGEKLFEPLELDEVRDIKIDKIIE